MNEALLQYIWKFGLFDHKELQTLCGKNVTVVHPGYHNSNSGPDFTHAKIQIGDTLWVGSVELHINGRNWYEHRHDNDPAYRNVILHVTLQSDQHTFNCLDNQHIPCIELEKKIDARLIEKYTVLMNSRQPVACAAFLADTPDSEKNVAIEKMGIGRMEEKYRAIAEMLQQTENDWEQVGWRLMARYLGSGIHGDALEQTAASLPVKMLMKHSDNPIQIEALVFGVAGFLNENFTEEYPLTLQREYRYLKKLHNLHELNPGLFKWARTRPANFPTLRLAQLAAIGSRWSGFFRKLLEQDSNFLRKFFETLNIHPYWKEHYRFEEKAKNPYVHVGQTTQNLIAINAIAPLLFAYGKHTGDEKLTDKSLEILNSLKGEKNHITRLYAQYRWHARSAFESQGLLHLKKNYCDKKQCLHCTIGHFWLKRQA